MSRYFSRKVLFSFMTLSLVTFSVDVQQEVFRCSPETLETLCNNENPVSVCAVDDDNQYLTFKSACEACGYQDTVSYTEGPCKCPQVPCKENQVCADGRCINPETITTRELVQTARKLLSQQKHTEALVLIKKVMEQRPDDSYPLYLASLASFGDRKYEESLKYVKKAIQIDPQHADYYVIRGRSFAQKKQPQQAEKQFQKALSLGFDDIGLISFYQAQNLLLAKRTEESIEKFEEALKYHPQKTSWYVRKALAHSINKEERMAILSCQDGLKIDPNNEEILSFMNQFKIMKEDKQQDLQDMQERNTKAENNTKGADPQTINKFIKEKEEEQILQFDRQRFEEKKKRQEEEEKKKKKATKQQEL